MNDEKTLSVQQELLNAMYTIAKGVVAQQNFDVTKDCKIIEAYTDNKGVKTGVYKVKSQDAIFDAYAQQNTEYFVNQMVYVSILNGDYDNDKFIIGQKIDKDNESSVYNLRMPFDDFLGLYNLTQYNPMLAPRAYWANCPSHGDDQTDVSDVAFPKSDDHVWHWENKEGAKIYATKLGLEVDVTTLLHGYNLISGHYGLRIVVNGEIKGNNNEPNSYGYKTYSFSDENMYGNPYAYTSPSTQQIVVDISDFLRVDSVDVWFTQDHDFRDESGNAIPYGATDFTALLQDYQAAIAEIAGRTDLTVAEKELAANNALQEFSTSLNNSSDLYNISFENLHCFLGMSAEELKEEEVILYTYEAMSYGIDSEDERIRDLDRQLNLAWVHATQKGVIMVDSYEQLKELEATLYWYKYDKSWELGHEDYDIENLSHRLGGNYWRPIDVVHPETGAITLTVTPDRDMNKQRYKAIIRFQGSSLVSNVLVFTNTATPETDRENLARNDKIILRCAVLKEDEKGNVTLLPDDAIGNFFVYNENNHILANDDNVLFSNVKYFIEPWIRPYSGDVDETDPKYGYQRLADYVDEDGNHYNFNVTWQFPESFTMIRTWGLLDDNARDENYWNNRTDILFERDKKATRYFYIDSTHNIRYNDNEISAIIEIEGMGEFTAKKELLFGRAGAFGCEFTPVITISEPAGNYYVDTSAPFELHCLVYDRQGRLLPEADRAACKFSWKYYGTANKPNNQVDCQNYEGFIGNVIRGRITKPEPFIVEVTVSGAAEYDITVRRGIMVSDDAEFMHDHDIICPDRVEFRSDGQTPFYAANPFEVQRVVTGSGTTVDGQTYSYQNELIYPEWKINNEKVLHLIPRTAEYPTFTLPNGNYVTRAQATQYGLQFSADVLNTNIAEPVAIGQQWTEDLLGEDYFTYIYFTYDGVTVAQAIAFAQNLYPSSLVNEWDGQSLALDEENGAIIAKMIAAGTKQRNRFTGVMMGDWREKGDESLETPGLYGFNMGQQAFGLKTDGTGFIGPSGEGRIQFDGRNALISNSSKTCYINLNPRRIADYLSPDGSGYKINNQAWDAINNQSISQYFLYTQTPRRISTFATNDDENNSGTTQPVWATDWTQHQEKRWVDKFLDDSNHDYFIVDPSYGVMTTGGIFARYGQLGHKYPWIISDYGLTQKNIYGRIFLGNPEKNLSLGTNIPTPTFTADDGVEKTAVNNFYSASFSNAKNIIQTGIRADGYLYTRFATIGGWYVNDYEIYSVDKSLDANKGNSQGFRKTQTISSTDGYNAEGYKLDLLNINSKNQFIAFNQGKFIIDGKHGWMGFAKDGIELEQSPSYYDMWIDFKGGTINFGKATSESIPHVMINGDGGNAYFAQGNILIDGEQALIYCGVLEDAATGVSNTRGTLRLADVIIQALTQSDSAFGTEYPDIFVLGSAEKTDEDRGTTDDLDSISKFSTIWDDGVAGYYKTTDTSYQAYKTYYLDASGSQVFNPVFTQSFDVVPSNALIITNQNTLFTKLNLKNNLENTQSITFTRERNYDLGEDESTSITYSAWKVNGIDVQLSDYGLSENSEVSSSVSSIVVTGRVHSDWTADLYEYRSTIQDLGELQKMNITAISSPITTDFVNPSNITGRLDLFQNSCGVRVIYSVADSTLNNTVVMVPVGAANGVLCNWSLDAKNVSVQDSLAVANTIQAGTILMAEALANNGSGGYGLVATQLWVESYIVEKIWPQIKITNNAAAAAMEKAKAAYSKAINGIELANSALTKISDVMSRAALDLNIRFVDVGQYGAYYFNWTNTAGGSSGFGSDWMTICTTRHYHRISGTTANSGGTGNVRNIRLMMTTGHSAGDLVECSYDINIGGALQNIVYDMVSDPDTGKLSWKVIGGTGGNFNIADTAFYKKAAVKTVSVTSSASNPKASHATVTYMDDHTMDSDTNVLSISGDSVVQTSAMNGQVASISLSDYYTAAYNAGWNACRNAMTAYSFTAEGKKTLYSKSGETYTSEGEYYWYRRSSGVSSTTLYTKPEAK